jgi:hypothetical protein
MPAFGDVELPAVEILPSWNTSKSTADSESQTDEISYTLQKVLCGVFELPPLRNTRNRDNTKTAEEKLTLNFVWIFFRHGLLNSPCRETPENVLKNKNQEKKDGWWVGGSGI